MTIESPLLYLVRQKSEKGETTFLGIVKIDPSSLSSFQEPKITIFKELIGNFHPPLKIGDSINCLNLEVNGQGEPSPKGASPQ